MFQRLPCLLPTLAALALFGAPAPAANHTVLVRDFEFDPPNLTLQAGDSVTWTNQGGHHNVHANDDSFRCAVGCDGEGGSGIPSTQLWSFTRTFQSAGTIGYRCDPHGNFGMTGFLTVQGGSGGGPGTLRFASGAVGISEGGGTISLAVQRVGGDDGAVSVQYATSNVTAAAGFDYTAKSGALNWANNDAAPKIIQVAILNDTAPEPAEKFQVILSSPGGGATLGSPATATVTINDNDSGGGSPPAAPTGLAATAQSTTTIQLSWTDNASNESEFRVERKTGAGAFQEIVTLAANAHSYTDAALTAFTTYTYRVRARNNAGFSVYSNQVVVTTFDVPGPCVADAGTLCLRNDRFKVEADWRFPDGQSGAALVVEITPDTGTLAFVNPSNVEVVLKVLPGCASTNHFWVFIAGLTNVEMTIRVVDTTNGQVKTYFNPLNRPFPPVQDTSAFATCP